MNDATPPQVLSLFSRNLSHIDPRSIIVPTDRQRTTVETDKFIELKDDIEKRGIMNPIIVRETSSGVVLVTGFNRLNAALELGYSSVPVRYLETLDNLTAKIVELSENLKRSDLPWRDHVRSVGEIHKLFKERDPAWTQRKTADEVSLSQPHLNLILNVFANLESPKLAGATGLKQAFGILSRFAERRTASIIGEIATEGREIFGPGESEDNSDEDEESQTKGEEVSASASAPPIQPRGPQLNISGFTINLPPINLASEPQAKQGSQGSQGSLKPSRPRPETPPDSIQVADFLTWAPAYTGPAFNFIHCDFPYGVNTADSLVESYENNQKLYWNLLDCFVENAEKLLSYHSHLLFWLSLRWQDETKKRLSKIKGIHIIDRPLIWLKTDMRGAAPGVRGTQPRHVYEAALLCSRGGRPLVKQISDGYTCHSVTNPIHPTQKPETMLEHFFAGLVDETTDMLDPTVGSGASIRAAEKLGAKSVLGLELDPSYASAANSATNRARALRRVSAYT